MALTKKHKRKLERLKLGISADIQKLDLELSVVHKKPWLVHEKRERQHKDRKGLWDLWHKLSSLELDL